VVLIYGDVILINGAVISILGYVYLKYCAVAPIDGVVVFTYGDVI
jgi:hypothetical protein